MNYALLHSTFSAMVIIITQNLVVIITSCKTS